MGGGHLSRPDFHAAAADPNDPLTEFYTLLMQGVELTGHFALPPCWALLDLPEDEPVGRDEAPEYLHLSPRARNGYCRAVPEGMFAVNSQHLSLNGSGRPLGLLLSRMGGGATCCVRLQAPFGGGDAGPMPDAGTQVLLTLTPEHMALADRDPQALARALAESTQGKQLLADPRLYSWTLRALNAMRRGKLHFDV